MILEKIKEHSGKISFFVISLLLIVIGAMYFNQKNSNVSSTVGSQQNDNSLNTANNGTSVNNVKANTKTPSSTTRVS
ncbi:MAG: hypothetical protein PHW24_03415 [Candidatus Moranbacteria bacterium]|nr:hypothetical protein [Candidatus Moranbacteria bacterium]